MFGNKKELPSPQPFIVIAQNSEVLYEWVKAHDTLAQSPFGSGQSEGRAAIQLGYLPLHDAVMDEIMTGIIYKGDGTYELKSAFEPTKKNQQNPKHLGKAPTFRDIFLTALAETQELLPLPLITQHIERGPLGQTFKAQHNPQNDAIVITPKGISQPGTEKTYIFHSSGSPISSGYCLHADGLDVGDQASFEKDYHSYARVIQEITTAIYRAYGIPVPQTNYVIEPGKDIPAQLKKLQQMMEMKKRMLGAAGIIDEDLGEEIRSKILMGERPDVTFDDIGGQHLAKEELQTVVYSIQNPDAFTEFGTRPPRGILLYGPPGTGKTLLAKAVAREAQATIFNVQVSDVLNALYGKTEKLLQAVFDEAKKDGRVIIFIDELDALAANRQYSNEVTSRIVSVLLTNMDGLESGEQNLVVIGATNRLDTVDPALKRAGRFDLLIPVTLPENQERAEIFAIKFRQARELANNRELFDPGLDINLLVQKTKGFTGADIGEIIRRGQNSKVREKARGGKPGLTTTEELLEEIGKYEPIRRDKEKGSMGLGQAREKP